MPAPEHLVVLMMENRSLDHMLGFARSASWAFDRLKGDETCDNPDGGVPVPVTKDAFRRLQCRPRSFISQREYADLWQ
jgi:hypothetical protein